MGGGWLSTGEAAELLGVTPRTLYRFIDEGDLAAFRLGRVIRVRRSDADDFLEAQRVVPGSLAHLHSPRVEAEPDDAE